MAPRRRAPPRAGKGGDMGVALRQRAYRPLQPLRHVPRGAPRSMVRALRLPAGTCSGAARGAHTLRGELPPGWRVAFCPACLRAYAWPPERAETRRDWRDQRWGCSDGLLVAGQGTPLLLEDP